MIEDRCNKYRMHEYYLIMLRYNTFVWHVLVHFKIEYNTLIFNKNYFICRIHIMKLWHNVAYRV